MSCLKQRWKAVEESRAHAGCYDQRVEQPEADSCWEVSSSKLVEKVCCFLRKVEVSSSKLMEKVCCFLWKVGQHLAFSKLSLIESGNCHLWAGARPMSLYIEHSLTLMNALCEFLRGKAHQYHSEEANRNACACHVPWKNCFWHVKVRTVNLLVPSVRRSHSSYLFQHVFGNNLKIRDSSEFIYNKTWKASCRPWQWHSGQWLQVLYVAIHI